MARRSTKDFQKKNALDILPEDIWYNILGLVRHEPPKPRYYCNSSPPEHEIPGHARFARILTVSNTWMKIAIPHLYRHLFIENHENLFRLASLLLTTPLDHPRLTWIKTLNFSFRQLDDLDEDLRGITNLNISEWLTVLCTRVQLRSCTVECISLKDEVISVLLLNSGHCLSHLGLTLDKRSLHLLRLVPFFANLCSLHLTFNGDSPERISDFEDDFKMADLAGIPMLIMSHVTNVRFEWMSGPWLDKRSLLHYLAACRFNINCNIIIDFMDTSTREITALNPLFLEHRDNDIVIDSTCTSHQSTIFVHSRSVQFLSNLPPLDIFSVSNLPHFISIHIHYTDQVDYLWTILDTLVKTQQNDLIYVRVLTTFRLKAPSARSSAYASSSYTNGMFRWNLDPREATAHQIWKDFIPRITHYAHALVARDIILLDADLKNVIGDVIDSTVLPKELHQGHFQD